MNKFNHWLPKRLKVDAITLYPFVFYAVKFSDVPHSTILHENKHIEQVKRVGILRFYLSYLLFYFAFRLAGNSKFVSYYEIPWEVEARKAEKN